MQPANCYLAAELSVRKIGFPLVKEIARSLGARRSDSVLEENTDYALTKYLINTVRQSLAHTPPLGTLILALPRRAR